MAGKKTGISRELIIHPGETIADILEERGITQAELAVQTGVSAAYVSNVIAGKKDISSRFAFALEYALGVPKSFWLNLQANYDAELLEFMESQTITEEERQTREALKEVTGYLQKKGIIPADMRGDDLILALRKALCISNIGDLKKVIPTGAFRMAEGTSADPYVLGAWLRLCETGNDNSGMNNGKINNGFILDKVSDLICDLKAVMLDETCDLQKRLRAVMAQYGIDFSIVKNFRGAPVQGYISFRSDGVYRMTLTIRRSFADIFWFSLFHELGHIVNGDVGRSAKFIDSGSDEEKERKADLFAENCLLEPDAYAEFVNVGDFGIEAIRAFADAQRVMPYIVIGRLQREGKLGYSQYAEYKLRYKWAEEKV
ncbi:MAG: HigA family addiction module antitoxin [Lachnospiraceae bacterium]|nr:HigA family addiction module antitoxin [Lachnospiraceae bacterium]